MCFSYRGAHPGATSGQGSQAFGAQLARAHPTGKEVTGG
jgi:hypothetical protein